MKPVLAIVLIGVLLALSSAAGAVSIAKDRDVSQLSPEHAKVLLGLLQHRARGSASKATTSHEEALRSFFEPSPYDHCCLVWDNLKCAASILQCATTCENDGLQACITCLGPLWEQCCCCLDNAGIHGLSCPTCCTN